MSDCLLLNQDFNPISILPLSVISWQHAIKLMFMDRIVVLEHYDNWQIHSEKLTINVPSVAVTTEYFSFKKSAKFSRHNLFLRDMYQCQYCLDTFRPFDLTIDHVIPRKHGGKTNWENCVSACRTCISKKGAKLIKPNRMPFKPDHYHLINKWRARTVKVQHPGWYKYLGIEPN